MVSFKKVGCRRTAHKKKIRKRPNNGQNTQSGKKITTIEHVKHILTWYLLAAPVRLERTTPWLTVRCSNQLSYGAISMTPSGDANYYSGIKTVCQCLLKKNRKICPQNPGADALTIWHGAGIRAKYLHTPVCWNWQTRRTQNPLVVTPYGFDPHHRHSLYLSLLAA